MAATEVIKDLYVGTDVDALSPWFRNALIVCVLEQRPPHEPENATHIRILDHDKARDGGSLAQLDKLDAVAGVVHEAREAGKRVLVHCGAGIERSPLAVVWYLHRKHNISLDEAYKCLTSLRPTVQERLEWLPHEYLAAQQAETK